MISLAIFPKSWRKDRGFPRIIPATQMATDSAARAKLGQSKTHKLEHRLERRTGDWHMRRLCIGLLATISAIGFWSVAPSQAKAQMPTSMIRVPPHHPTVSSGTVSNNPYHSYYIRPLGVGGVSAGPASYSFFNSPGFASGLLLTRTVVSWAYSPFYGPMWWYTTPTMVGWNWTPSTGYHTYVIPGSTSVVSPYLAGYLPPGFVVP
jgi:hypothetical protein